ncbi:MAG: SDR family oxidoreductase [Granulosicoccus sp.]|nr:SDR family oxidoreductase [Granulosicoccus sp.]
MLITGAGRGIGRAVAIQAAEQGYNLCLNYRTNKKAANELAEILQSTDAEVTLVQADVSKEEDVLRLFSSIDTELGMLDCLVNNAGILFGSQRLEEFNTDRIGRVLDTNVTGSMLCAREAVKRMSSKRGGEGGSIVNISSMAALLGAPNEYIDYAASKGAVDAMTTGLAKEVAADGIRVNAVRPGLIYTDIHASGGDPERVDRLKNVVPMQRGGTAEEVANAVLWLASDQASYVTATFINVSGGR